MKSSSRVPRTPRVLLLASDSLHDPIVFDSLSRIGVASDVLKPPWSAGRLMARLLWCDVLLKVYGNPSAGLGRIAALARLMGKATALYWIGTDVHRFSSGPAWIRRLTRSLVARSVTVSDGLARQLSVEGIPAAVVPILRDYRRWTPRPWPTRFTVLTYLPKGYFSFYGGPTIMELARERPQYDFLVVGTDCCESGDAPPNARFLGDVQDMERVYAASSVLIRLTPHDGLAKMPIEAMAMNRAVVYNHPFPNATLATSRAEILEVLDRLSAEPRRETDARAFAMGFPSVHGLAADLVRALGETPPKQPAFDSFGAQLRDRLQGIWDEEATWSPDEPATREEYARELDAIMRCVRPWQGPSLDVGTGAGRAAVRLSQDASFVAALDLSFASLKRLRTATRAAGNDRVHPVLGDAERLPFRTGSFSCAVGVQVWAHLEHPMRLSEELARVLRPGANAAISTGNARSLMEVHDRLFLALHELRRGRPRRAWRAVRGDRFYWLALRAFARDSVSAVTRELARAGFRLSSRTGVGLLRTPRKFYPESLSALPVFRDFSHLCVVGVSRSDPGQMVPSCAGRAIRALASFFEEDGTIQYRRCGEAGVPDQRWPAYSTRERYRLISLVGLESYGRRVVASPEIAGLVSRASSSFGPLTVDDRGLRLWWRALAGGGLHISDDVTAVSEEQMAFARLDTQALAFLVLGLSACAPLSERALAIAGSIVEIMRARQEGSGLFHAVSRRDLTATFNYQIYSVMSLAAYAEASGKKEALSSAHACARKLCTLQGPLGQWWWTYNVCRGTIADRYPVFSVHQLGMAPMALFRVGRVTGDDFSPWIRRGARWVAGANELGEPVMSPARDAIWRSIRRRGASGPRTSRLLKRLAWHGQGWLSSLLPGKEMNREHRAYEYGWLLAALAEAGGDESWLS